MRRSEYNIGEFLVTDDGCVFIHDGYVNGDGYGCIIGESSGGVVLRQSDWGNFMRHPVDHIADENERERLVLKIMRAKTIEKY